MDKPWITYFPNGNKEKECHYKNGKPDGIWLWYYENGNKRSEGVYREGIIEGLWIEYYPDGTKYSEGIYIYGLKNGLWIDYYPDEKKLKEEEYRKGTRDGISIFYHRNGHKEKEGLIKNGISVGKWAYWMNDGTLWKEEDYNGSDGNIFETKMFYKEFYLNGKVKQEGIYQDGLKEEKWILYSEDGEIDKEIIYKNGIEYIPLKEENGEFLSGYDIFNYPFLTKYRKCSCLQKTHYFSEEGWNIFSKNQCPLDSSKILEIVFISDQSLGTKEIENSEIFIE